MTTVTLSTKYQVVIPKEVRQRLHVQPGKKYQVIAYGDCIEFVPVRGLKSMRGFLKGLDTDIEREEDRV
ncbi:MAG: AbrB/MazE/SpoVT family DNA-binding domain-containing protein [Candidatus Omnitrophica bacterium]|nr:AbrB/MazE/SpoVT family DNA-binding domain-containing protein [Candidatus Omnitrophota bacterium]